MVEVTKQNTGTSKITIPVQIRCGVTSKNIFKELVHPEVPLELISTPEGRELLAGTIDEKGVPALCKAIKTHNSLAFELIKTPEGKDILLRGDALHAAAENEEFALELLKTDEGMQLITHGNNPYGSRALPMHIPIQHAIELHKGVADELFKTPKGRTLLTTLLIERINNFSPLSLAVWGGSNFYVTTLLHLAVRRHEAFAVGLATTESGIKLLAETKGRFECSALNEAVGTHESVVRELIKTKEGLDALFSDTAGYNNGYKMDNAFQTALRYYHTKTGAALLKIAADRGIKPSGHAYFV
jgi:hypothetical protein